MKIVIGLQSLGLSHIQRMIALHYKDSRDDWPPLSVGVSTSSKYGLVMVPTSPQTDTGCPSFYLIYFSVELNKRIGLRGRAFVHRTRGKLRLHKSRHERCCSSIDSRTFARVHLPQEHKCPHTSTTLSGLNPVSARLTSKGTGKGHLT